MKKVFTLIILSALMIVLMAGCSGNSPDVSTESDVSTGSDDSAIVSFVDAVPFGQWADVERYTSGTYHPCKVRIAEVIRDSAGVQSYIDLYNTNSDSDRMITPLTGNNEELTEYIVIEYEVLFPDDFPTIEYGNNGIANPHISFDARTNDGGGFVAPDGTHYVGMGMSIELIKLTDDELPLPGDTFKGAILLQMLKNYDDFHLEYMYKVGDSDDYIYAFFAVK